MEGCFTRAVHKMPHHSREDQRWQEQRTTPYARPPTCGPEPNIHVSGTFGRLQPRATHVTSSSKPSDLTTHPSTQTHIATCQVLFNAGKPQSRLRCFLAGLDKALMVSKICKSVVLNQGQLKTIRGPPIGLK